MLDKPKRSLFENFNMKKMQKPICIIPARGTEVKELKIKI